jgi:cytochrome c oxidase subunit 3
MTVADDPAEDHGEHHLPAVADWPRGFGEASWWPIVAALGATGVYVGAALFILGQGPQRLVGQAIGPAVLVVSVGLFLAGLYGWLYHAFVVDFWERGTDEHGAGALKFGMLLFLGTEVATFGAGFVYFFFVRTGPWSTELFPELLSSLVLVNTAILVLSSLTLHYAHVALREGNRSRFVRLLGVTLLLGLVFVAGQGYEYYDFLVHENFTLTSGVFGSAFYGLTGLHGLHVSLGAVLLAILTVRAVHGQFSPERHTAVSTVSMYWHFVDVVWLFLVVTLYVGATV